MNFIGSIFENALLKETKFTNGTKNNQSSNIFYLSLRGNCVFTVAPCKHRSKKKKDYELMWLKSH